MRKIFCFSMFLLSFARILVAQSVNLVIEVNEKIVIGEIGRMYLIFGSGVDEKKISADYVPGKLTLSQDTWKIINSDTSIKFSLHFDYTTYKKNIQQIANFYVDLSQKKLNQSYLILNIYDFRDRKYKNWYKSYTDKEFLAELRFPNSGMYIRVIK
ncbi:MAG TPA: hypothetical protein VHZ50_12345 [Puia sp.]|nr:hypothetical protein [Puia sp.]